MEKRKFIPFLFCGTFIDFVDSKRHTENGKKNENCTIRVQRL